MPLLIGIMSPSGGGKTFSALRLATGMRRVYGGDIYGIDPQKLVTAPEKSLRKGALGVLGGFRDMPRWLRRLLTGVAAHAEARGSELTIVADEGPFGVAAQRYPHVVCAVDHGMIRGLMAGLYGDTTPTAAESRAAVDGSVTVCAYDIRFDVKKIEATAGPLTMSAFRMPPSPSQPLN
mgnify:CR=1 FL=1